MTRPSRQELVAAIRESHRLDRLAWSTLGTPTANEDHNRALAARIHAYRLEQAYNTFRPTVPRGWDAID